MTITIFQTLASLIFVGVGIEMANNPPTSGKERWAYRGIFIFIGLVLLALAWFQYRTDQKEKVDAQKQSEIQTAQIQGLNDNQTNLEHTFKTKFDALQVNQLAFQEEQRSIQMAMATNPVYDTTLRERIIASDEKFQALNSQADDVKTWLEKLRAQKRDRVALQQIKLEAAFKRLNENWISSFPYLDFFMSYFTNTLAKIANQQGDHIKSTYNGLPHIMPVGDSIIQIGEIKFDNKADWSYHADINSSVVTVTIYGSNSKIPYININSYGGGEVALPEMDTYHFKWATNDYKTSMVKALDYFISDQLYKYSTTNK